MPSSVLSLNNASLGYYGGNNTGAVTNKAAMGAMLNAPYRLFCIEPAYPSFGLFGDINDGSSTYTSNTDTSGFIFASRILSTQKIHSIRGIITTKTESSAGIPTVAVVLGARNDTGNINSYSPIQHRLSFIGDGLTDSESSAMYTSVQNYQNSMSRAV